MRDDHAHAGVEGAAQALLALMTAFAGWHSDRLRRRAAPDGEEEDDAGTPPMPEVPPPPVQEADEHRLAEALGRFSETVVREVMTPRPDVTAIAVDGERVLADRMLFGGRVQARVALSADEALIIDFYLL